MTNISASAARPPDDPGLAYRGGTRSFVQQLEEAARENPVPAALIGMGLLWMFMGGSRTSLFGHVRDTAGSLVSGGSRMTGRMGEAMSDLGSRAGDMTRTAAAAATDTVSSLGSQIAGAASSAYESTGSTAAHAMEAFSDSASRASQAAQRTGAEWGRTAQHSMGELFERQPLLLGAVGLAIGAGIAASLPVTETETRFMGEASDELKEKAQDFVSEKADQMKSMAARALQEAEAQGLTPRAAGDALRGLADKAAGVAETAGRSLKEQITPERPDAAGSSPRRG